MSAFDDLDDFIAIPRVNQLRLAPDGSRLVATVAAPARSRKKYVSALWEIDPQGHREARRLTLSAAGESSPRFLPDGTLLFLSKRRADDGSSDSGVINPGKAYKLAANKAFTYHCTIHPSMKAAIRLEG